MKILTYIFFFFTIALLSCSTKNNFEEVYQNISEDRIEAIVKEIGSDYYQGRKPFTIGEERTIEYLINLYKEIGIEPINGSFLQEVPMVEVDGKVSDKMILKSNSDEIKLNFENEFVAWSKQLKEEIILEKVPVIFAGYGIVAPEYGWNDYEGIDVKDKIVVVMVNDPGFDTGNPDLFKGNEMTYYGRWTYKYEEAARQGASGCIIIHRTKGAGYPWNVVRNGALIPELYMKPNDDYLSQCEMEGWITSDAANKMLSITKFDESIYEKALDEDFQAFELGISLDLTIQNSYKFDVTNNIIGIIEGDELKDEVIVYSAHWDHLGIGKAFDGDSIYNGAVDNGTSLAWMLEIARAFKNLNVKPKRSIVIFAPTAEESGLIGSKYFAENCPFPLDKVVANINNDLMLPYGKMKDVMITGYGQSELENYVEIAAEKQNRYIAPDPNAHTGMFHRSDHASFAKVGVPCLFVRGNLESVEHGKEWMTQKENEWIEKYYHKPKDEYDESFWDLSGVTEDAKLLFHVGYLIANDTIYPEWSDNSEFKSIRESYMNK